MAKLHPLHHSGDDLVHAVLELFILPLALGVADLLEDHLLGGLGSNAAELDRRQRIDDEVADRGVGLLLLRVLEADLLEIVVGLVDHFQHPPQPHVAALGVDLRADVVLGAIARAGRSEEHTSELQSLMRISYAVFCLKKKKTKTTTE